MTPACVAQTRAKEPAFLVQVLSLCRKLELARYAARSRAWRMLACLMLRVCTVIPMAR